MIESLKERAIESLILRKKFDELRAAFEIWKTEGYQLTILMRLEQSLEQSAN